MTELENEKRKKLLEEMRKERGYVLESWVYLAEKDLEFLESYNNLYNKGLTDGKALPAKIREFIAIALLAYRGLGDAVYEHARRALRLGATKLELLEAIETSAIPGGAPTLAVGLRALHRIEEEEKKK